jgi:hypothetical protein
MTEVEKLKAQLEIAIEVLEYYENKRKCQKALEKIKEIEKSCKKVVDNKKNKSSI